MSIKRTIQGPAAGFAPAGYRLPAATALAAVSLQVADLGRSTRFYEQVLGMRQLSRSPGEAVLGAHGADRALVRLRERPGAAPVPRRGRLGLYHFAILLPDRAALGRFVTHLAAIGVPAGAADHLVSEALYLSDPDGLGIEVYADRPRDSWLVDGRQIRMATDPLDLGALAAAAGETRWSGMPAGTRIGHVHLHVGDLEQAQRLYHAALGLDRMVWSYPGALFLAAGGYHHHLGLNTWAGAGAQPPGDGEARLIEWRMVLPAEDVRRARESVMDAGFAPEAASEGWRVADPWGTVLHVVADEDAC